MLDFEAFTRKQIPFDRLVAGLGRKELIRETNEMVDAMLARIAGCRDEDVTFVPIDPKANDIHAAHPDDVSLAWTLGHVIVHTTASSEESAFLAAELARGVPFHGRSRAEVPWQSITTIAQCRLRLEESRRMRIASLDVWPDAAHLEIIIEPWPGAPMHVNAVGRFVVGLLHDSSHLDQIAEIARQAKLTA
jgi:hypothetical protein